MVCGVGGLFGVFGVFGVPSVSGADMASLVMMEVPLVAEQRVGTARDASGGAAAGVSGRVTISRPRVEAMLVDAYREKLSGMTDAELSGLFESEVLREFPSGSVLGGVVGERVGERAGERAEERGGGRAEGRAGDRKGVGAGAGSGASYGSGDAGAEVRPGVDGGLEPFGSGTVAGGYGGAMEALVARVFGDVRDPKEVALPVMGTGALVLGVALMYRLISTLSVGAIQGQGQGRAGGEAVDRTGSGREPLPPLPPVADPYTRYDSVGTGEVIWQRQERSPGALVTHLHGLDVAYDMVLEGTGVHLTREKLAPYFLDAEGQGKAKKVVVTAPVKDAERPAANIVYGVNHDTYDPAKDDVITAASCTTNCLAPVVKVIHEQLKIKHGCITTVHDVTNTQSILDCPNHKKSDLRRARSALVNLAPTSTGSATAIALIFPELKGKLNGLAVRVPLTNASITDCVFEVERATTAEEVNAMFKEASEGGLKGILGYETLPLVSTDYINDRRSGIVDALSTQVIDGTMVKAYVWYDNEMGYSCRFVDVCGMVATSF